MLALDTCVVVDLLRGRKSHYVRRLQEAQTAGRKIMLSSLVLHELSYGAMISARPEVQLKLVEAFVERAQLEPWTTEDGVVAARVRADLRATGFPINVVDSLIAGQAVNRGWNIVTSNIKDFIRVPGLTVIDWSDPEGPRQIDHTAWSAAFLRPLKDPK